MDPSDVVATLAAHRRGVVSVSALVRAVVEFPDWRVPCRHAREGSRSIWLFPGERGQWWVCVFTSPEAVSRYEMGWGVSIGPRQIVEPGASWACRLPRSAHGIVIDPGSPHAVSLAPAWLDLVREMGEAAKVEAALLGLPSEGSSFELLRAYGGFRVAWQGPSLMLAPGSHGRLLAAVFTAEDAVAAYESRHGPTAPPCRAIDGQSLFEQLRFAPIDGIVFNCEGPVGPKVVERAVCDTILGGVEPASAEEPSGQRAPAASWQHLAPAEPPATGPAPPHASIVLAPPPEARVVPASRAQRRRAPSDFLPRLVRQDSPELTRGAVARPLVVPTEPTQPILSPMVCLAVDEPDGTEYATTKTLGTESLEELIVAGARRLYADDPPEARRFGPSPGVLCFHGRHAAECLLAPDMLQMMHDRLRAAEIVAALPLRGVVIACGMNHPSALLRLQAMTTRVVRSAGERSLYDQLILIAHGALAGRVSIELEPPARAAATSEAPPARGRAPSSVARGSAPRAPVSPPPSGPQDDAPLAQQGRGDAPMASRAGGAEPPGHSRASSRSPDAPRRARSLAECSLYLNLLDYPVDARRESIATQGNHVVVRYDCARPNQAPQRFEFAVSLQDMAATSAEGPIRYGVGSAPSTLIDAGQFFELAEGFAKAAPGSLDGLDKAEGLSALAIIERAAACMDEVIKFIPDGEEMVPDAAFFTASGHRTRAAHPKGRWSRARLGAIGGVYRRIAGEFREHAQQRGWLYG